MQRSEMKCEWNGTIEMRKKVKRMKAAMCVGILEQSKCAVQICVFGSALLFCGSFLIELLRTIGTLRERREEREDLNFGSQETNDRIRVKTKNIPF